MSASGKWQRSNERIRKVATNGIITTVAGSGARGFSGDGGPATAAQFSSPTGVAVDSSGNFYIADYWNQRIHKVNVSTGIITTVAGSRAVNASGYIEGGFSGDGGPATAAQLNRPVGVAVVMSASGKWQRMVLLPLLRGVGLEASAETADLPPAHNLIFL